MGGVEIGRGPGSTGVLTVMGVTTTTPSLTSNLPVSSPKGGSQVGVDCMGGGADVDGVGAPGSGAPPCATGFQPGGPIRSRGGTPNAREKAREFEGVVVKESSMGVQDSLNPLSEKPALAREAIESCRSRSQIVRRDDFLPRWPLKFCPLPPMRGNDTRGDGSRPRRRWWRSGNLHSRPCPRS